MNKHIDSFVVSVRINRDMYKYLLKLQQKNNRSLSYLLKMIILYWIAHEKK
jgi:hypothetical protein